MRKQYKFIAGLAQVLSSLVALSGCGSSSSPAPVPVAPVAAVATTCAVGSVYTTSYGCLPQGSCPVGTAMYASQCVATTGAGTGAYGGYGNCAVGSVYNAQYGTCLPQTAGTAYGNQCTVGAVYTTGAGGCYQQGACPAGYVMYGTRCVSATAMGTGGYNPYGGSYGGYNPYGSGGGYNPYGSGGGYNPYGSGGLYAYGYVGSPGYNPYAGGGSTGCGYGQNFYPGYGCN